MALRPDDLVDFGVGPCAKQVVTATVVAADGRRFTATNHCDRPQAVCQRAGLPTGVGYELCRSVCGQRGHAEVNALRLAAGAARGARLRLAGHTYACEACRAAVAAAGVVAIEIEEGGP